MQLGRLFIRNNMCSKIEVEEVMNKALLNSSKNMNIHLEYIREALTNNKVEHKEIMSKVEAYIGEVNSNHVTKDEVNILKMNCEKLEKVVYKAIATAVLAVVSNLITIIYFLMNSFIIK